MLPFARTNAGVLLALEVPLTVSGLQRDEYHHYYHHDAGICVP